MPLYLIVLLTYIIYWFLVEKTKLREKHPFFTPQNFRSFWLVALLVAFLSVAITGTLQVYTRSELMTLIHVNSGFSMVVIASLHIIVRYRHFVLILKKLLKKT